MDAILSGLGQYGMSGLLAAAFVGVTWYVLTQMMPAAVARTVAALKDEAASPKQYRILLNQDLWGSIGGVESAHKLVQSFVVAEIAAGNGILDQLTIDHGPVPHPGRSEANAVNPPPKCEVPAGNVPGGRDDNSPVERQVS